MEHHSNIVPWQMACKNSSATLKVIPMDKKGVLDMKVIKIFYPAKQVVAVNHISNALGTINPVKEMIKWAHKVGAAVLIDGAQVGPH